MDGLRCTTCPLKRSQSLSNRPIVAHGGDLRTPAQTASCWKSSAPLSCPFPSTRTAKRQFRQGYDQDVRSQSYSFYKHMRSNCCCEPPTCTSLIGCELERCPTNSRLERTFSETRFPRRRRRTQQQRQATTTKVNMNTFIKLPARTCPPPPTSEARKRFENGMQPTTWSLSSSFSKNFSSWFPCEKPELPLDLCWSSYYRDYCGRRFCRPETCQTVECGESHSTCSDDCDSCCCQVCDQGDVDSLTVCKHSSECVTPDRWDVCSCSDEYLLDKYLPVPDQQYYPTYSGVQHQENNYVTFNECPCVSINNKQQDVKVLSQSGTEYSEVKPQGNEEISCAPCGAAARPYKTILYTSSSGVARPWKTVSFEAFPCDSSTCSVSCDDHDMMYTDGVYR